MSCATSPKSDNRDAVREKEKAPGCEDGLLQLLTAHIHYIEFYSALMHTGELSCGTAGYKGAQSTK